MDKIHILLYQESNNPQFIRTVEPIVRDLAGIHLTISASMSDAAKAELIEKAHSHVFDKPSIELRIMSNDAGWQELAASIFKSDPYSDYFLFLSDRVEPEPDLLQACLSFLKENPDVQAVNPLFKNKSGNTVSHLGTVADSHCRLHYLYEGISASDALALKPRVFQLGHPAALLLKTPAFHSCGGMDPTKGTLSFLDFCVRLNQKFGACFGTTPDAATVWEPDLSSQIPAATWNSFALRGRILPGLLRPDYHLHAANDGLEYTVSEWLNEGIADGNLWDSGDPWLSWRHNPNPITLTRWLGSLDADRLAAAIRIIQSFPAFLPLQFRYYEVLAGELHEWASRLNIRPLKQKIEKWQKGARQFHYRKLLPGMKLLLQAGLYNISLDRGASTYDAWLELAEAARPRRVSIEAGFPRIAVVMPVYDPQISFLRMAIESVLHQTYQDWELCIADDASSNPEVGEVLRQYQARDSRIKVEFRSENGHICKATNSAMKIVEAPWIVFMDHDDLLSPDALASVAEAAAHDPDLVLIYSDSDHVDVRNVRRTPHFKSDFSCEMPAAYHLSAYATHILRQAGFMREGTEGSQDQDLFLRVTELCKPSQIRHIARILYHWRVHTNSTAGSIQCKPYVMEASRKLREDMAKRRGIDAIPVSAGINNLFKLRYKSRQSPLSCAIVFLARGDCVSPELQYQLDELQNSFKFSFFWQPLAPAAVRKAGVSPKSALTILEYVGQEWPKACNNALQHVNSDLVLFISPELRPLPGCEPGQLLLQAAQPQYAMVGSMLWRNGILANGGFYPNVDGMPFILLQGTPRSELCNCCWGEFVLAHETIGCAWQCMALRHKAIAGQGGFNESMGELAHVDFCLEQRKNGLATIVSPWGQWENEERSDAAKSGDTRTFFAKWGRDVAANGLRNPNLARACDNDWRLCM